MAEQEVRDQDENGASSVVRVWSDNEDTVGAILLGILALILLVAFLRVQKRNRELVSEQAPAE